MALFGLIQSGDMTDSKVLACRFQHILIYILVNSGLSLLSTIVETQGSLRINSLIM